MVKETPTKMPTRRSARIQVKRLNDDEKRKANRDLRDIHKDLKVDDLDFHVMVNKLSDSVAKQNDWLQTYGVNELLPIDAKYFNLNTEQSYKLVKKFNTTSKFETREFLKRLRQQLVRNSRQSCFTASTCQRISFLHLHDTGLAFNNLHHSVPPIEMGFRPDTVAPVLSQRTRSQRTTQNTQATQPTQYDSTSMMNNTDESDKRLNYICTTLKKLERRNNDGVPFLQASINPKSFSATVENMFNIAFLARQSLIKIFNDDEDSAEPMIRTVEDGNSQSESSDTQSVLSLDVHSYRQLIDKLEISKSAFK